VEPMNPVENLTLRRTSTAQQVADGLSDAIMRGEMPPGTPIRESSIAATLGISRNTVREAVRMLEASGLVRYTMHHGAAVVDPSPEDLDELYRARIALELSAASEPRTPYELAPARAALQELMAAYETHDPAVIAEKDLGFHAAIVSMLKSKRINEFYGQLARELRFFLMVLSVENREYESQEGVIEEHTSIMTALESGDPAKARAVLEEVLTVNAEKVRTIFAQRAS
jgi:DNA-binding GntR family transcriptional regulator